VLEHPPRPRRNASGKARAVDQESHEPAPLPGCPWWCSDRYADPADHPAQHEGHPLEVDAFPAPLLALLVMPVGATRARVMLGQGDDSYASVSTPSARSLCAVLRRLADVAEEVVSL
jgi:hypothetical protein